MDLWEKIVLSLISFFCVLLIVFGILSIIKTGSCKNYFTDEIHKVHSKKYDYETINEKFRNKTSGICNKTKHSFSNFEENENIQGQLSKYIEDLKE